MLSICCQAHAEENDASSLPGKYKLYLKSESPIEVYLLDTQTGAVWVWDAWKKKFISLYFEFPSGKTGLFPE